MSEMVERVADAIARVGLSADPADLARKQARAAIEAMREPTEEMTQAGFFIFDSVGVHIQDPAPVTRWQAMIDAALK